MVFLQTENLWNYFVKSNLRSPRSQAAVCCLMGVCISPSHFGYNRIPTRSRGKQDMPGYQSDKLASHTCVFLFVFEDICLSLNFLVRQLCLSRQRKNVVCTKSKLWPSFYTVFHTGVIFLTELLYQHIVINNDIRNLTKCYSKWDFLLAQLFLPSNILLVLSMYSSTEL